MEKWGRKNSDIFSTSPYLTHFKMRITGGSRKLKIKEVMKEWIRQSVIVR